MSDNPHDTAAKAVAEGRPVEAQYVRGGRKGSRVLLILGTAFVLTAIGFTIVWLSWMRSLGSGDANAGQQAVDAAAFQGDSGPPAADAPVTASGEPTHPQTGDAPNVNAPTVSVRPSSTPSGR